MSIRKTWFFLLKEYSRSDQFNTGMRIFLVAQLISTIITAVPVAVFLNDLIGLPLTIFSSRVH